ncbi:hypothetical protein CSUI_010630 [Cystoisospora suis]|uniref:Transmembrane protein n=1 Tax=Cystoisospora suis TaxID=483139 RepID=A0A2C6KEJ6_9APIC|nr:hypothetical protein CSUI_010630 [Cystoisospora suis]
MSSRRSRSFSIFFCISSEDISGLNCFPSFIVTSVYFHHFILHPLLLLFSFLSFILSPILFIFLHLQVSILLSRKITSLSLSPTVYIFTLRLRISRSAYCKST